MLLLEENKISWNQLLLKLISLVYLTLSCSANERTEMKRKIYLSEAWMCSEFGMLITDVERERVNTLDLSKILNFFILTGLHDFFSACD